MPSVEFPCLSFVHPLLGVQYRPYAFLELYHQNRMVQQNFLVDSGADVSVIPYQAGLDLGLPLHMNDKIYTLGGGSVGLPVVYRPLQMQIGPYRIDVRVAWALHKYPLFWGAWMCLMSSILIFDKANAVLFLRRFKEKAGASIIWVRLFFCFCGWRIGSRLEMCFYGILKREGVAAFDCRDPTGALVMADADRLNLSALMSRQTQNRLATLVAVWLQLGGSLVAVWLAWWQLGGSSLSSWWVMPHAGVRIGGFASALAL